jgi:polar amino acid transport system substrate-binding protein
MRIKVQATVAGLAVLLALTACGSSASSDPGNGSKTSNTVDISDGVRPHEAAVKLLPQSYKDKGELTVAMHLHY